MHVHVLWVPRHAARDEKGATRGMSEANRWERGYSRDERGHDRDERSRRDRRGHRDRSLSYSDDESEEDHRRSRTSRGGRRHRRRRSPSSSRSRSREPRRAPPPAKSPSNWDEATRKAARKAAVEGLSYVVHDGNKAHEYNDDGQGETKTSQLLSHKTMGEYFGDGPFNSMAAVNLKKRLGYGKNDQVVLMMKPRGGGIPEAENIPIVDKASWDQWEHLLSCRSSVAVSQAAIVDVRTLPPAARRPCPPADAHRGGGAGEHDA